MFSLLLALKINFIKRSELKQWRNYWLIISTLSFLVSNTWIYFVTIAIILGYANQSKSDKLPLFFAISCAAPLYTFSIPGFGMINYLITLNYASLLTLFLLMPQAHNIKKLPISNYPFYSAVGLYVVMISILDARETTTTHSLRLFVTYIISILIPFMAISRSIVSSEGLKKCLFALALCLAPLALAGCFESLKYWKLYSSAIAHILGDDNVQRYGLRGNSLRASALFASPIAFGYMMVIGIGLVGFCKKYTRKKHMCNFVIVIFLTALYYTKARGPWLGLIVMIVLYIWSGSNRFGNFTKFSLASVITILALSATSFGAKLISMLPFMSSAESHETSTVDYRIKLLEQAWLLFREHFMFGLANYRDTPEMEVMRQGQGIIDVVNSYVDIALNYGIVGLGIFSFIFFGLLINILGVIRRLPPDQIDLINIGRALYCILGSIIFIIFTVSSINYIPIFYWLIAGLSSGYIRLCTNKLVQPKKLDVTGRRV
tara:strand:+ start:219 stop:1685 length:1467 start_codon:yes stop_codon:yes gene_type:complete